MGKKTKRQNAKDIIITFSDEEDDQMTDYEWAQIQKKIEQEIKHDDLVWEAICVYHEFEDNDYWISERNKPTILEFIAKFTSFDLSSRKNQNEGKDDEWTTVY